MTAGIRAGDIITQVNGTPVRDARELARTIGAMPPNTSVRLTVLRNGAEQQITLTLGELPNQRRPARRPSRARRIGNRSSASRADAGAGGWWQ